MSQGHKNQRKSTATGQNGDNLNIEINNNSNVLQFIE